MPGGNFQGPQNNRTNGGLGRQDLGKDNIGAFILGGVATGGLALGVVKKCIQLSDAEDVGITAAYDIANGVLVHYHLSEYFRLAPDATVYFMLVAQGTTMTEMCDHENEPQNLYDMIRSVTANREIKFVGVVLNPDTTASGYTSVVTNGVETDAQTALPKAQALLNALELQSINVSAVIIEARNASGSIASIYNLAAQNYRKVAFAALQDPAIASLDPAYQYHAAVGTVLGSIAVRKVNESIGSTDIVRKPRTRVADAVYSITDNAAGLWQSAALSGGRNFNTLTQAEKDALDDKHYIYAGFYEPDMSQFYLNQDTTAISFSDDYCGIAQNRVWDKAADLVRKVQIPLQNGEVFADPSNGNIDKATVADWEARCQKALDVMLKNREISGCKVTISPDQNFLGGDPIKTYLRIVPVGINRAMENYIGFTTSL